MANTIATITGTMLTPGVSKNNRLYTREAIGRAVGRMRERLNDPNGLPIVMRTHHDAGDDSRLIVGRITDVTQDTDGSAHYEAKLFGNKAGRDIAKLVDPSGGGPALKSTSIHGYWLGPVERHKQAGQMVESGSDIEINAIDFTGSPGVTSAQIKSVAFESLNESYERSPEKEITESYEANVVVEDEPVTVTASINFDGKTIFDALVRETQRRQSEDTERDDLTEYEYPDDELEVYERRFTAKQRKQMASSGQAMPGGRYPIANKSDLRNAIRAVGRGKGDHNAIRQHIIRRAKALGLSSMIPDNWTNSGASKENAPEESLVGEHFVKVCVGDEDGDVLKVCADNLHPDVLKSAIKQAAQIVDKVLGQDGRDVMVQDEDDLIDDKDNIDWKIVTCSDDGDDYDTDDYDDLPDDGMDANGNGGSNSYESVANKIIRARQRLAERATRKEQEPTVAETDKKTVEQPAPTSGLTEADLTKLSTAIAAAVATSVSEAMNSAADKYNAVVKGKAKGKKGKADTSDDGPDVGNDESTKDAKGKITETDPKIDVEKLLEEQRKKMFADIRETLLKENGLPGRRGYRYVEESDAGKQLTGDELWNKRGDIWGQVAPSLFGGAVPGVTPARISAEDEQK